MLALELEAVKIDPRQTLSPRDAFLALAGAAQHYLSMLDQLVANDPMPVPAAVITRVRGTGPGVAFGSVLAPLVNEHALTWSCPFEGSENVSGAAIRGSDVLGDPSRTDGFLVLRFAPGTRDLPLHVHPDSDRFIFAIGGRGFFHVSSADRCYVSQTSLRHTAVRDRDALMFRRGAVHTFSTAEHLLTLLSYHRPFIELDEPSQYVLTEPPISPADFLRHVQPRVSFDAWTWLQ
jgi:hypothetical protein